MLLSSHCTPPLSLSDTCLVVIPSYPPEIWATGSRNSTPSQSLPLCGDPSKTLTSQVLTFSSTVSLSSVFHFSITYSQVVPWTQWAEKGIYSALPTTAWQMALLPFRVKLLNILGAHKRVSIYWAPTKCHAQGWTRWTERLELKPYSLWGTKYSDVLSPKVISKSIHP